MSKHEFVEILGLSEQTSKILQQAGVQTIADLQSRVQAETIGDIEEIGEQRTREINNSLRRHIKNSKPVNTTDGSGRLWYLVSGSVFVAVAVGLSIWGFSKSELADHQIWILQAFIPVASAFAAGAFTGSLTTKLTIAGQRFAIAAAGAFAVWYLTHSMLDKYLDRFKKKEAVHFQIMLKEGGVVVKRPFELRFRYGGKLLKADAGPNGIADVNLLGSSNVLEDIRIVSSCFTTASNEPIEIVENRPIEVSVIRVTNPPPPPLSPFEYPDPRAMIPRKDWPSEQILLDGEAKKTPSSYDLSYENQTNVTWRLLLFNFKQFAEGDGGPWHVLPSDPCAGAQHFSGFQESNGWFGLIARFDDGSPPVYLGTSNLYAKDATVLLIRRIGEKYVVEHQ